MMMADNPTPMQIVQTAYEQLVEKHKDNPAEVQKALKGKWDIKRTLEEKLGGPIEDFKTLNKIPSLNCIQSVDDLRQLNGQLVRFSAFVQDMIDQDFFVGFFMTTPGDLRTGIPNKYMQLSEDDLQEIDNDTFTHCQENYTMNRGNLICTSLPNENKWSREIRYGVDGKFDEIAELLVVKVYDDILDAFKMNKAYELIGTLEYKPLPQKLREERAQAYSENGYLPPNVIPDMDKYPVLHIMTYMPHPHKNATKFWIDSPKLDNEKIAELTPKLFNILLEILGGDELAAEYVLLTLISKVQTREDGSPVGISCINLYSLKGEISNEIVKGIERFMKLLQPHTLVLPIDLDSLSTQDFVPKKNYDTNRLQKGDLQILNSTCALLDETNMKEGKSEGERLILNMRAIASLIEEQSIKYNFQYHEQSFDCSCPVIIVSTGRSVFKNATPVPVNPVRTPNPDALNDLEEELIIEGRYYFNQVSRREDLVISDECSKHIQDKFVEARKEEELAIQEKRKTEKDIGAKTLHTWLTYSKLKVASSGVEQLTSQIVDNVIEMEAQRKKRVEDILKRKD